MLIGPVKYVLGGLFVLLLAAALVQTARIEGFKVWPINIPGLKSQLATEKQGRINDRTAYETAQAEAKRKNAETVQKIEAQHEEITDRARSDYSRDLDRLRSQARANQGAAGGPGAAGVPKAPGGTDEKAGVPLSTPELLRAAELELQIDKLIDWVNEQGKVRP